VVNPVLYVKKMVDISLGGKWQPDAITSFQHILKYHFKKRPLVFKNVLENYNEDEINSFFYFYLDAMHPSYKELPQELATLDPTLRKVALEAMQAVNNKYK
jgi:hypothetical protein